MAKTYKITGIIQLEEIIEPIPAPEPIPEPTPIPEPIPEPEPNPFAPQVMVNPTSGYAGTIVAVNSKGFAQNTTATISVGIEGGSVIFTQDYDTGSYGHFAGGFYTEGWEVGRYFVVVRDSQFNIVTKNYEVL
jgi:hypothetical protein